jgi:hypothetical protein
MLWGEDQRGLPNSLARCALFTACGPKTARRAFNRDLIVSLEGAEIFYTGKELRQDDQDVFLQIVHMARSIAIGDKFVVSGYVLLKGLRWGYGQEKYARLKQSVARLVEGTLWVSFSKGRMGYTGRLIDKLEWIDGNGSIIEEREAADDPKLVRWMLQLDPKIVRLFGSDDFTLIEWEQRLKLTALEKWLHSFYATHAEPFDMKVATLHRLCGSATKALYHYREMLKHALAKLVEVGIVAGFRIDPDSDLVHVVRRRAIP